MKKIILLSLIMVIFISAVACVKRTANTQTTGLSESAQPQESDYSLTFEEKIKCLSEYTIPVLENPGKGLLGENEAREVASNLLSDFLSDEILQSIDYSFDKTVLLSNMILGGRLLGENDNSAFWEITFLLQSSSAHLEISLFIDAETADLYKIVFQGHRFNLKNITESEAELFEKRFEETANLVYSQDVVESENAYYRSKKYSTDNKAVFISMYIDNGYFGIYFSA